MASSGVILGRFGLSWNDDLHDSRLILTLPGYGQECVFQMLPILSILCSVLRTVSTYPIEKPTTGFWSRILGCILLSKIRPPTADMTVLFIRAGL